MKVREQRSRNRFDCGYRAAHPFFIRAFTGWRRPKVTIPGTGFAGVVAAVASGVSRFKVGDRVFGYHESDSEAHADYLAVDQDGPLALIPEGLPMNVPLPAPRPDDGSWPRMAELALQLITTLGRGRRVMLPTPPRFDEAFIEEFQGLLRSGEFRPVLDDRRFDLEQIVAAYRYVEVEQKPGNVLLRAAPSDHDQRRQGNAADRVTAASD